MEVLTDQQQNEKKHMEIPDQLPLLPVRDLVVFPYMIVPLFVGRKSSINALNKALAGKDRLMVLTAQKESATEHPRTEDLFTMGTFVSILRVLKLPDGRVKILVQGLGRAQIASFTQMRPFFKVKIRPIQDYADSKERSLRKEALMRNIREQLGKIVSLGRLISPDILVVAENLDSSGRLADLVVSNLGLSIEDAQQILEILNPDERLKRVAELLNKEYELLQMQYKIQTEAKEEMTKTQKEYFLREQMKAIKKELGEIDEKAEEIKELKAQLRKARLPEYAEKEAEKQLRRIIKMHPEAAEASMLRTYLEWLSELPWAKKTKDNLDIKAASRILDEDHYNLEKVKGRILEYLSVHLLKENLKGPILCFVGPPGVGKTSLGKSIARAMRRKFTRISLGGVRDEAEIRGHRRTYIGALPGRIIQGIRQAGTNNPVFMLDEVDKIGTDFRGDPAAALLEVLDPEQNYSFSDHYLGMPFDLSNVMFITTANITDPIPSALRDRMEVINLSGYTEEEKLIIARRCILPKLIKDHGISQRNLEISDQALTKTIKEYTREAGLRNMERELARICRKIARKVAERERRCFRVHSGNLHTYLGPPKYLPEQEQETDEIGVSTGLAWTLSGGEIIYIESSVVHGKGKLILTGQLGEVMKESAQAALSYVRSRSELFRIPENLFSTSDLHIHVPAGGIPKDGPSAGITMATSLASAVIKCPVRRDVAMTGEITLRGRVLPIGGIKEKVLAAKRAGIKEVILPALNKKDLTELPKEVKHQMRFIFVKEMDEVLRIALQEGVERNFSTEITSRG